MKNNLNKLIMTNDLNIDFTKYRLNEKLTPWQITGFTDSEGGFNCTISQTGKGLTGYSVKLEYKVTQKEHSQGILNEINSYFNCGSVVIDNRKTNTMKYRVGSLSDILTKIIPHFIKYPCLTSKFLNFENWKEICLIMSKGEHLTNEGLDKISNLLEEMNTKRSFKDKYNHCNSYLELNKNEIGKYYTKYILPTQWVQAFLDGESTFYTYFSDKDNRVIVNSSLEVAQSNHDVSILIALKTFFNGGYIKPKYNYDNILECQNSRSVNRYILRETETIIKFINEYPLLTRKHLDYLDWKKIIEFKKLNAHNTKEGISLIKKIRSGMNSKR